LADESCRGKTHLTSESRKSRLDAWLEHLKGFRESVVDIRGQIENRQLEHYEPTINRLYQRLYARPLFSKVKTKVDASRGSFAIQVLLDPKWNSSVRFPSTGLAPSRYFSEAQLNVLALSIFLSNAFSQRWSQFVPLFLDDPVQNMDDFNAYAFLDTLRTYAVGSRQFLLTTCDLDFYKLMLAKFRCLNSGGQRRFIAYRFDSFSSGGPDVRIDTEAREAAA
jgi:DNA repair protein SbcC/Rad50